MLRATPKIRPLVAVNGTYETGRAFDSIERFAKFVQNLLIIFGIFGGAISLLYAQYDRRVDRTVTFTKEFNSSVRKSYLTLNNGWNTFARENNYDPKRHGELIKAFFSSPTPKEIPNNREENFEDVLDFFDSLYVCVNTRSCDRNAALAFFQGSIRNVYEAFAVHIFERRNDEHDQFVGQGLENLYGMEPESSWSRYF